MLGGCYIRPVSRVGEDKEEASNHVVFMRHLTWLTMLSTYHPDIALAIDLVVDNFTYCKAGRHPQVLEKHQGA